MSALPPGLSASIIIPSYESQTTVAATLQSLRNQLFDNFETILIDSGRSDEVARIAASFPEVRYQRSEQRLLPHEARNVGTRLAQNEILIFTDPDVVAAPDWLEKLITTYLEAGGPVVGAIASLQRNWLEVGVHIAKFDLWLPGGAERNVPVGPTANFLCPRHLLNQAGGFDGREMIGDTLLSWELVRLGQTLRFAPKAIVYHDHRSTFRQLLQERFARGADFARLRMHRVRWKTTYTIVTLAASIVPLRLAKLTLRSYVCSVRAGCAAAYLRSLPIVIAGHASWLAGEVSQYWRRLFSATDKGRKAACVS